MKVFLICPVRAARPEETARIEAYVKGLEAAGYEVHWPARDTRQVSDETQICGANRYAMEKADEVHVWWTGTSEGSVFDLGMAYAMRKTVRVANRPEVHRTVAKSFANLLLDIALR